MLASGELFNTILFLLVISMISTSVIFPLVSLKKPFPLLYHFVSSVHLSVWCTSVEVCIFHVSVWRLPLQRYLLGASYKMETQLWVSKFCDV